MSGNKNQATPALRVKICGITRAADAELACQLGADAIGFIFYRKSPRSIAPSAAAVIARKLPATVARVGVFVQPGVDEVEAVCSAFELSSVQLHGQHDFELIAALRRKLPVICAINISPEFAIDRLHVYRDRCDALLLDGYQRGTFGGTGRSIDWQFARQAQAFGRVILAGGLRPETIAAAAEIAQPYAVDVNSGVEDQPGMKNHAKLQHLFTQLKDFRRDWNPTHDHTFPLA